MKDALGSVQSVLVLGGGSEIGLATARALAAEHARTFILGVRNPADHQAAAAQLREAGASTVDVVPFDARDTDAHPGFVEELFSRHGDIDLVLLAFGVLGNQAESEREARAALAVAATNYLGGVSVLLPVAQRLRAQGHGTIAVLSSVAAERGRKSNFVYGASKAGIDVFAQGLSDSLAGTGVQVLVVRPGFVRTRMTAGLDPAPFATTPEAVARAIVEGVRRGAHTVWVPPVLRFVMSALRHLPRPVFRRLNL